MPRCWADATETVTNACSEMELGELVHGDDFSFFASSFALEIMDPRLDSGMNTAMFRSVEEAIANGDAPATISVLQLIDIMDHLFSLEATWHNGASLSMTVFTCLYILQMDHTAMNPVLHACCRAVKASCNQIRTLVCKSDAREEEDFVTNSFGLPLEGDTDQKSLAGLNLLEEKVAKQLKVAAMATKWQGADAQLDQSVLSAVLSRIRFRKYFLNSLLNLDKPQGKGLELARKFLLQAQAELQKIREEELFRDGNEDILQLAAKTDSLSLNSMDGAIILIQGSEEGPHRLQNGTQVKTTSSGQLAVGFDPNINRKWMLPAPIRPLGTLSFVESMAAFDKLIAELLCVCDTPISAGLSEVHQFLMAFQRAYTPGPITRCRIQRLVIQDSKLFGRETLIESLFRDLNLPLSDDLRRDSALMGFMKAACRAQSRWLQMLCSNWSRQRREMVKLLGELDAVMQHGDVADSSSAFRSFAESIYSKNWWTQTLLVSWTAEQTCHIIQQILFLGFETQLYEEREYCAVFWYLDHVLSTLMHNMEMRERNWFERQQNKDKERKGNKKKTAHLKEFQPSSELQLIQCYNFLCKAYVRMIVAFVEEKMLTWKETSFSSEQERFEQRFEAFNRVSIPDPLPYSLYKQGTSVNGLSVKDVCTTSMELFRDCGVMVQALERSLMAAPGELVGSLVMEERRREVKRLVQITGRNKLALQVAVKASRGSLKVSLEANIHPCFPTIVLKST